MVQSNSLNLETLDLKNSTPNNGLKLVQPLFDTSGLIPPPTYFASCPFIALHG